MKTPILAVAFLQNMYAAEPERLREIITKHGELARRLAVRRFLFGGCRTGRRLQAAFGSMIDSIHWDESTPQIAGDTKTIFPADIEHMRRIVGEFKPRVVLTFGRIAGDAVEAAWAGPVIKCPHPTARGMAVLPALNAASDTLWAFFSEWVSVRDGKSEGESETLK
jgi:hypothetical protein